MTVEKDVYSIQHHSTSYLNAKPRVQVIMLHRHTVQQFYLHHVLATVVDGYGLEPRAFGDQNWVSQKLDA